MKTDTSAWGQSVASTCSLFASPDACLGQVGRFSMYSSDPLEGRSWELWTRAVQVSEGKRSVSRRLNAMRFSSDGTSVIAPTSWKMRFFFFIIWLTVQVSRSTVHSNNALRSVLSRGKYVWNSLKIPNYRHDPLEINPESHYTVVSVSKAFLDDEAGIKANRKKSGKILMFTQANEARCAAGRPKDGVLWLLLSVW